MVYSIEPFGARNYACAMYIRSGARTLRLPHDRMQVLKIVPYIRRDSRVKKGDVDYVKHLEIRMLYPDFAHAQSGVRT